MECVILTTLYFAGAKIIDSQHTRKEDLQYAFPLDVLMVQSSMLIISTDGERPMCGGFSLGETICFESLEFIADSGAAFMCSTHSEPTSPLWAMIDDSTEEFHTASRE
jgi:hypothetical protein